MQPAFLVAITVAALGIVAPADTTPLFLAITLLLLLATLIHWPRMRPVERTVTCVSCGFVEARMFMTGERYRVFECSGCGLRSLPNPGDLDS